MDTLLRGEPAVGVAVAALPPGPLTAVIENAPSSHDGENVFTFELRFSDEFPLSYRTLRDHAFKVTGGTVTKAHRMEKGSNLRWLIEVRPDSAGAVIIALPVTVDCAAQGAICTEDGRMLSSRREWPVSGPLPRRKQTGGTSSACAARLNSREAAQMDVGEGPRSIRDVEAGLVSPLPHRGRGLRCALEEGRCAMPETAHAPQQSPPNDFVEQCQIRPRAIAFSEHRFPMSAIQSDLALSGDETALTKWDNHYLMVVISQQNGECDCPGQG